MPKGYSDFGVVTKTQNYKEADKLITILTMKHGLIIAFAKGVRRSNSQKTSHLDLLTNSKILITGKDHFFIQEALSINQFLKIKKDLKKVSICMTFCEIINNLVPINVEDEELYTSTINFLDKLSNIDNSELDKLAIKFARYLLRHLGYKDTPPPTTPTITAYFEQLMSRKIFAKEIV